MAERTDRELLELAAKAAGIERGADRLDCGLSVTGADGRHRSLTQWNPLTDDGDRYRLIAKLKLAVDFSDCTVWHRYPDGRLLQEYWGGDCGDEAHAVLRLAAEMGRAP